MFIFQQRRAFTFGLVLYLTFGRTFSTHLDVQWAEFKDAYSKHYSLGEETARKAIWIKNLDVVRVHNEEADRGQHTYRLGMNEFGDLTSDEFAKMNGFVRQSEPRKSVCKHYQASDIPYALPATVDWRKAGYVTEIINQGQCGSSWAFSATAALEGQHFKKTGHLVSLSASNLMDCSRAEGNDGCEGGLMDRAFQYVIKNNGIDTTEAYPYKPQDQACNFTRAGVGATAIGCRSIPSGDEASMKKAVALVGPIATAVDAQQQTFQLYKSGVYYDPHCSKSPNHGIPIVGYGTDERDYWLLKNSWGTSWGLDGYMKIARNADDMCGTAFQASFPTM